MTHISIIYMTLDVVLSLAFDYNLCNLIFNLTFIKLHKWLHPILMCILFFHNLISTNIYIYIYYFLLFKSGAKTVSCGGVQIKAQRFWERRSARRDSKNAGLLSNPRTIFWWASIFCLCYSNADFIYFFFVKKRRK